MNAAQMLLRILPLLGTAALLLSWRSPSRAVQAAALAATAAGLVSRADAAHAGLLLAAVALGSAALPYLHPDAAAAVKSRAAITGAAAALLAAVAPGVLDLAALGLGVVDPAALLRGLVAAGAWAAAAALPVGAGSAWLAVALLWLPWGLPAGAAPQIVGFAAVPLAEGAAVARLASHGLAGASEPAWLPWLSPALIGLATAALALVASGRLALKRPTALALPLLFGAVLAAVTYLHAGAELQTWRPVGSPFAQPLRDPWQWDMGPWALQAWRWIAVALLLADAAPQSSDVQANVRPTPGFGPHLATAIAAASLGLLGWWTLSAPQLIGPGWLEDPSVWALATAIVAAAAIKIQASAPVPGWFGPLAACQWLVATALAGGVRSGASVAGLLP